MFLYNYYRVWADGFFRLVVLGVLVNVYGQMSSAFAADNEISDKPASLFFYRCAGCHTVGGGKKSGPDLVAASKWSEVDLKAAVKKMEKNAGALSEENIAWMVEFLKDPGVAGRIEKQKQQIEAEMRAKLPPPSFEAGQALFRGQKVLRNAGPACIHCHHFAGEGGSLGLDLTLVKDKMTGVVLQSAIENSSYKIMRAIYAEHKVTTEESLHLAEFLSHPEKVDDRFAVTIARVHGSTLIGVVLFVVLLWALNRYRKGPTRTNLLKKYRGVKD